MINGCLKMEYVFYQGDLYKEKVNRQNLATFVILIGVSICRWQYQ